MNSILPTGLGGSKSRTAATLAVPATNNPAAARAEAEARAAAVAAAAGARAAAAAAEAASVGNSAAQHS